MVSNPAWPLWDIELDSLVADCDDDFLAPTDYAINEAKKLLNDVVLEGWLTTSGGGEIRVEWQNDNKHVNLVIASAADKESYLYHDDGPDYHIEKDISIDSVNKWLTWLGPKKPKTPSAALQAAMNELEAGGGQRFATVEEMFAEWNTPEEDEAWAHLSEFDEL